MELIGVMDGTGASTFCRYNVDWDHDRKQRVESEETYYVIPYGKTTYLIMFTCLYNIILCHHMPPKNRSCMHD